MGGWRLFLYKRAVLVNSSTHQQSGKFTDYWTCSSAMDHYFLIALFAAALLCPVPGTTAAPPPTDREDEHSQGSLGMELPAASVEAIPSNDFTRSNISITLDEILAQVAASQQLQEDNQHQEEQR